ncbi:MAG: response regulator [Candidatus Gastranaerophilales bacterium]|nr:response regulator [Candidatus Gastranaerophilales bacterium]
MSDEKKIEINEEILKEVFKAANIAPPSEITDEALLEAVFKLKQQDNMMLTDSSGDIFNPSSNNILVIDDIGVVTYQLKILLRNLGYNVQIAKDIFSGINTFIKSNYAFVIMDLFVSTEQEGLTLLNETKKIITKNNLNTKIIVITASNKAENKVKCMNGGADMFLKKEAGWQDRLIEIIESYSSNQV